MVYIFYIKYPLTLLLIYIIDKDFVLMTLIFLPSSASTQIFYAVKFNMADKVHRLSLAASELAPRRHLQFYRSNNSVDWDGIPPPKRMRNSFARSLKNNHDT